MNKVKLSTLAHITMGQSPEGKDCNNNYLGVPLLNGPTEFTYFYPKATQFTTNPKKISKKGDILFCVRGSTTGRMNWSDKEYAIGRGLAAISHKQGIEYNYFLKYLLKYYINDILKTTNGSTFPNLTSDSLASYEFLVPDLDFQKKIASVLSTLDAKIELNNKINKELEAMAKTLYDYWFVQFDFPDENGKPYKSSGGKMVWSEELKREIPEGWEVYSLNKLMRIVRGASPRPIDDFLSDSGIPWIKISDVSSLEHFFVISTKEYIKPEGASKSREIKPNTLILSNSASPAIPKIVDIYSCVHDGWLIIDSFKNGLYNEFMLYYFENFRNKILNMGSGSIFKNLKTDYIKDLYIALPQKDILNKSKNILESISSKILNNARQNQKLTELRDWLLPMLMNGQVKVS